MTEAAGTAERRQRIWHRMVGAAVLAALVAILVPFLLDIRDNDGTVITHSNIPERPPGFRVEEISLVPEPAHRPAGMSGAAPESASPATTGSGTPAVAAEANGGLPPAAAPRGPLPQAFAVQIGSFSSDENATVLRDRLRGAGYSAFLDRVMVDGRTAIRVLVGPDARREHSEALRDRLDSEMKLKGVVIGYE